MGSLTFPGLVAFMVVLSTGLAVGAVTAAVGYPMGSELTAYVVAVALAAALTERPILGMAEGSRGRRLRATGLCMLAAGAIGHIAPMEVLSRLIHPLWFVGLACLIAGHLLDWRWGQPFSNERVSFVIAGVVGCAAGHFGHQPIFLAAGIFALLVSTYGFVLEQLPSDLPALWRFLLPGAMSLGILIVARAHLSMIIHLLKACF